MMITDALDLNPDPRHTGKYPTSPLVPRDYADARGRHSRPKVSLVKDRDNPYYMVQVRDICPAGHGSQIVIDAHSASGFCAGYVHTYDLACGHQVTYDDSYLES